MVKVVNLGFRKNLVYGAGLGFVVSAALNQLLLVVVGTAYYYEDGFSKMLGGGAITAVAIALMAQWFVNKNDFYNMNLWVGLISLPILGLTGMVVTLFFWGPISILFSVLGADGLIDYLAEDVLCEFCLGGVSVGVAAGMWNNFLEPFK